MLAFVFSLMIFAAQAPATEEAPASQEAVKTPTTTTTVAKMKSDPGRLICRKEAKANSRFTTKTCKTAEEWDDRAETARQAFGDTQNRPVISLEKGS